MSRPQILRNAVLIRRSGKVQMEPCQHRMLCQLSAVGIDFCPANEQVYCSGKHRRTWISASGACVNQLLSIQ